MSKDLVFICNKCEHNLYVSPDKIKKILKLDCPNCGEEAYELWTLSREEDYKKRHK